MAETNPVEPLASGTSQINVGPTERVVSVTGGLLLAAYGLRRFSLSGLTLAATGGALLFRGVTGHCPINAAIGRDSAAADRGRPGVELRTTLTVDRPRDEVYRFWRRLENLPQFMHHLEDVRELDPRRSVWTAKVPKTSSTIEWEAEIEAEEEGRRLAWRSVAHADVDNAGEVRFEDAPGGRGTEVHVHISYRPPAAGAGRAVARLLNPVFEQMVKEDVRRFKHLLEAGSIPTTEGQPTGA